MAPVVPRARPEVVDLTDPRSLDRELTGNKAAALAHAASLELPVLPGFALTTAWPSGVSTDGSA